MSKASTELNTIKWFAILVGGAMVAAAAINIYKKKQPSNNFSNATGRLTKRGRLTKSNCQLPLVGGIAMPGGIPEPQRSMIQEQLSTLQQRANDAISRYNSCCKNAMRPK